MRPNCERAGCCGGHRAADQTTIRAQREPGRKRRIVNRARGSVVRGLWPCRLASHDWLGPSHARACQRSQRPSVVSGWRGVVYRALRGPARLSRSRSCLRSCQRQPGGGGDSIAWLTTAWTCVTGPAWEHREAPVGRGGPHGLSLRESWEGRRVDPPGDGGSNDTPPPLLWVGIDIDRS